MSLSHQSDSSGSPSSLPQKASHESPHKDWPGKPLQHAPVITLSHVSKRYANQAKDVWALQDIDFTIEPGVFGLLGRNGAGKTTLLQMLATLSNPAKGSIQIGPYDTKKDLWHIRHFLGFLPQEIGFYPKLTVKDTLRYLAQLQGIVKVNYEIDRVLEAVNLSDRKNSRVGTLSGGMKRRLGLAQSLLGEPQVLIVDEPTAGLDPVEQQRFRMLLATLGSQGQHTIILSTHIVADIEMITRRLAVLEKGHLIFTGSVHDLAEKATGKNWIWRTTIDQVDCLRQQGSVTISSIAPVMGEQAAASEVVAHIIGACPDPQATAAAPTMEDGYFSLIGRIE